jgi:hypothetical protein
VFYKGTVRTPTPRLRPGEHLHVDHTRGFAVVRPAGWRVADEAELRAAYDTRNWRRREYAPSAPPEPSQLPALTLTGGPHESTLTADSALIELAHEPDTSWSPLDQVEAIVTIASEWIHFDACVVEPPTECHLRGLPAATAAVRYTALTIDAPPALCLAHLVVARRGPHLLALTTVRVLHGGVRLPDHGLRRVLESFRIFSPATAGRDA